MANGCGALSTPHLTKWRCVVALEPTRTDGCFSAPEVEIIAPKITPKHWLALTGLLLRAQKIQSFRSIVIFWQAMSISLMRIVAILMQYVLNKVFPNAMLNHQHCLFFRSGPKQNVKAFFIPVSVSVPYALSRGSLGFAFHGSFFNHFLIG